MRIVVSILVSLLLAGCSAPGASTETFSPQAVAGGSGGGGGGVTNSAPAVPAFAADRTSGENDGGFVVVFTGAAFDPNTEMQLATLSLAGPAGLSSEHAVTPAERLAQTEPASFGADGWKVWSGARNDGTLHFRHRLAVPLFTAPGAHAFHAVAADTGGLVGRSPEVVVTLERFSLVSVAGAPVDAGGVPQPGASWGGWNAEAGARDVSAVNWLKLVNDGDKPDARVVIDFTQSAFVGVQDANFSVPIDGNVRFAWFEDTTPELSEPEEASPDFAATSPAGAVTVAFTGKGNVIYVTYRLGELPPVLPVQPYAATFTVTEL